MCPVLCIAFRGLLSEVVTEDPAVPGINGCSRGVYKNIAEISPDLVYP